MKNSKIRRALLLAACAVLLVTLSVGATLAYLTSTDSVTNTFTVGKVKITLDEKDVDDSTPDKVRDQENKYQLFPAKKYEKDPTIHVDAESEDCWLFVKVVNEIADIEVAADDGDTIAEQIAANGWKPVAGETDVYAYERIATKADTDIVVFETFQIAADVDNDTLADYANKTIVVTAYAVQSEGFATAEAAWTAAKSELIPTTPEQGGEEGTV